VSVRVSECVSWGGEYERGCEWVGEGGCGSV
jgi:hypothetical protein